jgi:hypothetical protein
MSKTGDEEKPLAVQLAEAGVEDADAIAAAVKADSDGGSGGMAGFLSNTSPNEIAQAAGTLMQSFAPRPAAEAAGRQVEPEPARADGGESKGSPMRQEGIEEMEAAKEADSGEEPEENDE